MILLLSCIGTKSPSKIILTGGDVVIDNVIDKKDVNDVNTVIKVMKVEK